MEQPPTVAEAIGARLRELRGERPELRRQDDVARRVRAHGLDWTRDTVASVETGRRGVSVEEFIVLCVALRVPPWEWFDPSSPEVAAVSEFRVASFLDLHRILRGDLGDPDEPRTQPLPPLPTDPATPDIPPGISPSRLAAAARAAADPATYLRDWWADAPHDVDLRRANEAEWQPTEQKAARKLDVSPLDVSIVAHALWDRSLTDERDSRAEAQATADTDARSMQAIRGHVTRELLAEIQQVLDEHGTPGGQR